MKVLNVRLKTIQLLEENIELNIHDIRCGNGFGHDIKTIGNNKTGKKQTSSKLKNFRKIIIQAK